MSWRARCRRQRLGKAKMGISMYSLLSVDPYRLEEEPEKEIVKKGFPSGNEP